MPRLTAALLTVDLLFSVPAMPLGPSEDKTVFSDQWMLGKHVAAPWAKGMGQQDTLNKLLGHPIRFLRAYRRRGAACLRQTKIRVQAARAPRLV
jgi:hypothetical protein